MNNLLCLQARKKKKKRKKIILQFFFLINTNINYPGSTPCNAVTELKFNKLGAKCIREFV